MQTLTNIRLIAKEIQTIKNIIKNYNPQVEKGFTLIEVLIAVVILGVSFTVLLNLLYQGQKSLAISQDTFYNFLTVDSAIKEGKTNGINIKTKEFNIMSLPLVERTYEKNGIYLKTYQPK